MAPEPEVSGAAFAARVEAGLRGRGMSLRALCREVGLDPSFFSKVLAGKRSPPSDESVLRAVAGALGLDAVELVVSAGRIPTEWRAIWRDPELFREIHARAQGAPASPRPCARAAVAARPRPPAGDLAEELL
ncbi:MAG: helix-turn-helix transcriptional regulator [Elusimicrobia bacterium]|nr:helix-turn-helix transcriptional regulator [Elusimicrobiota bacterium]